MQRRIPAIIAQIEIATVRYQLHDHFVEAIGAGHVQGGVATLGVYRVHWNLLVNDALFDTVEIASPGSVDQVLLVSHLGFLLAI